MGYSDPNRNKEERDIKKIKMIHSNREYTALEIVGKENISRVRRLGGASKNDEI